MLAVEISTGAPVASERQNTTAALSVRGREIQARLGFAYKDALKALPGARWDSRQVCWAFPLSALSARRLMALCPTTDADDVVTEYAARCATVNEAMGLGIPAHYEWRTPPWAHQRGALACVAHLDAVLLEMGMRTGKSKIIVDWISNQRAVRALILCPRAVVDVADITRDADAPEYAVAQNTLTKLLRLAQIASGYLPRADGQPVHLDNGKRAALDDILEDAGDVPIVVFCRFHTDLDAVHAACAEAHIQSCELSGRRRELDVFQRGDAPVIAVQIQAGEAGIDLSRASVVVYYSIGYSLGDYQQSLARMEQKGKKEGTLCIHIIAKDTVDDGHIHPVLRKKQSIVDFVSARIQNDSTKVRT